MYIIIVFIMKLQTNNLTVIIFMMKSVIGSEQEQSFQVLQLVHPMRELMDYVMWSLPVRL